MMSQAREEERGKREKEELQDSQAAFTYRSVALLVAHLEMYTMSCFTTHAATGKLTGRLLLDGIVLSYRISD